MSQPPKSGVQWPYPSQLDALRAAPANHRLLFENEFVRVIDACIPPGESTPVHTHKWPATLYILSSSDFVRYDGNGTVLLNSIKSKINLSAGTAMWSESLPPHALQNVGIRIYGSFV